MLRFLFIYIFIVIAKCDCPMGIIKAGLSQADKDFILKKHNDLRQKMTNGEITNQPRAINMKTMVWDDKLAVEAQKIAETCNFEHVSVTDDRWWWVGQNLGIQYSTVLDDSYDWNSPIQAWFDEHELYTYSNQFNYEAGHYTQVVWADSDHVGCGATIYERDDYWRYNKLYVCNYGPGGNIQGQYPYETDEPVKRSRGELDKKKRSHRNRKSSRNYLHKRIFTKAKGRKFQHH